MAICRKPNSSKRPRCFVPSDKKKKPGEDDWRIIPQGGPPDPVVTGFIINSGITRVK